MTPATAPPSQSARIARWLLSADPQIRNHTAMSALALLLMGGCVGVLLWLAWHGHAPLPGVALWGAVSLGGLLAATVAIRLGWTRRLSDPSLTLAQMLWALTSAAAAYLVAVDGRDMLPCMVAMVLLFGSLGLHMRQIVGVTLYALTSTTAAMLLTPPLLGQPISAMDAAHAMMLAVVLLACMAVSLRLHTLRSRLQQQRMALSQALEEHRTLASRDALTGLLNRRSMMELLELEQRRCVRGQRRMALAVLDIDHWRTLRRLVPACQAAALGMACLLRAVILRRLHRIGAQKRMNRVLEHRPEIAFIDDIEILHARRDGMGLVDHGDALRLHLEAGGGIILAPDILQRRTPVGDAANHFGIGVAAIDACGPGMSP